MNEFDQFMKHDLRVKNYARYTDDFVIVSEDKKYLNNLVLIINKFLNKNMKLELHPNKVTIRKAGEGIDFLGYNIFPDYKLLRRKTKHRIIRKIKSKIREYKEGSMPKENLEATMQSYLGVLSHANTYEFAEYLENRYWFWLNE